MDVPVGMAGVQVSLNGQAPPPPPGSESSYNIPGVLHFLKSEWVRFERERSAWELEKVELQSKIAFLNGQRKGHENLKSDLIRRIKMLEFALKQERSKNHKLVYGTDLIIPDNKIEFESEPDIISSSTNLTEGRNILRQLVTNLIDRNVVHNFTILDALIDTNAFIVPIQFRYLRELGYTEGVLEARAKVKNVRSFPDPLAESEVVFLQENQDNEPDAFKESEVIVGELPLGNPVTTFDDTSEMPPRPSRPGLDGDDDDSTEFTHTEDTLGDEVPPRPGDQDVAEAFEEFSFLKTQEGANSDDDGSSADDEDEASFERSKQTKKLKSFLNTYGPEAQPQQAELSPTKDKSAEENRWNEGLLPGEIETMKDQLRKTTEARKQRKNRPSRDEMNTMRTVLQDDEGVFETETLTQQSVVSSGVMEGERGPSNEGDSPEAFQPFQGLGDATKDKDLYGPLAMISVKGDLDMEAGFEDVTRKMWEQRFSLQSHYDSVTTLEFHPSETFILTASEDTTVKLWNFDTKSGVNASKKPGVLDLEPVHTFRAHEFPIVSLAISKLTPKFYTGDVNGNICTWNLNTSLAPYDEYDPQLLEEITVGHQNAIWDLVVHPTQDLLISAGADGVVKLWKPFNVAEFVLAENGENFQPTSICVLSSDTNLLAVSYANARTAIFDINTEKLVTNVKSYESYDGTQGTQINRVVSHPTSSVLITAHEDKQINFFDFKSGEVIHSMIAHQDAVTGLDIDPQGLFILTSGHDRSLRLWDYHSKSCIQEISTHWSKFDQGIFDAKFHPTLSYFASAGADALCKIFMKRKD